MLYRLSRDSFFEEISGSWKFHPGEQKMCQMWNNIVSLFVGLSCNWLTIFFFSGAYLWRIVCRSDSSARRFVTKYSVLQNLPSIPFCFLCRSLSRVSRFLSCTPLVFFCGFAFILRCRPVSRCLWRSIIMSNHSEELEVGKRLYK